MRRKTLKHLSILVDVLKPEWQKLLPWAGFAFLCVGGATQTYAFIDDVPGLEKPWLYDMLRPFEFWFPWILFTAPLHFLTYLVCWFLDKTFGDCSASLLLSPGPPVPREHSGLL